ncbi:mannosyl-oligosaccharide glucosidase [Spea bombifrons]|uniref:mannosyl-oligosaccharide glucosidase n=1 Tax=Spea bombifrons TaxID=233779 RepID=UPI00234B2C71|nr:mannosyl-oligosaccharide glucosidase [Spea bombifrons]XP_053313986.1 mannosyl-oligosaccharide glucosidase [Spea bombifrons]
MTRERRRHVGGDPRPCSSPRKAAPPPRGWSGVVVVAALCCAVAVGAYGYGGYVRWRRALRVVTPHPAPPVIAPDTRPPATFWGSYRPQVYFGMKTRSPRSVVTGVMWMAQSGPAALRHTCEQSDGLPRYGWLLHDGVNFGVQEVRDRGFTLTTEFVKRPGGDHGGDWSWRVTVAPQASAPAGQLVSLLFYVATDGQGELTPHVEANGRLSRVTGTSEELGGFTVRFPAPAPGGHASYNHLSTACGGLHMLTDVVRRSLRDGFTHPAAAGGPSGANKKRYFGLDTYRPPPGPQPAPTHSRFVVHQVTFQLPFHAEVLFESDSVVQRPGPLAGEALSRELERHRAAMEGRFQRTFQLEEKGFAPEQVAFAKAALSNMVGGMGYFYGHSVVQSLYNPEPVLYPPAPLYTAVPSRSFFPRGFLWDEGFHLMLIARWDPALAWQSLGHWLDLMNADGWIPREQILGPEARSKVPDEFVVQRDENANPPTLFLALSQLLATPDSSGEGAAFLRRAFPRLKTWYDWFNTTQAGPLPHTYRWRGRDTDPLRFLNPKTLTSGLDDYPRASHPSEDERHVDLRCWMALASRVMADISELLGEDGGLYRETERALTDNALLDRLHWSQRLGAYADYGNHTQNVALEWERPRPLPGQDPRALPPPRLVRVVKKPPRLQFVGSLGYVSLFPFLLQVLAPDWPRLGRLLDQLGDADQLWTPYGLRSLAKSSPLYMQRNTEHDAPYWRGPIWMNMNYLAVRALHAYSRLEGPYRQRARDLYRELRENLLANLYRQYRDTGFLWEQYHDETGRGQGCYPFTGWSSLIVLVMAEQY